MTLAKHIHAVIAAPALLACVLLVPSAAADKAREITLRASNGRRQTVIVQSAARITIPAGRFHMGATREQLTRGEKLCAQDLRSAGALNVQVTPSCRLRADVEGPAVEVFVHRFAIDRLEVTRDNYSACVRKGDCAALPDWVQRLPESDGKHPAEAITFSEATRYCRAEGGRLPTEAEWERAARGLGGRLFPWGKFFRSDSANHGQPVLDGGFTGMAPDQGTGDAQDGFMGSAVPGSFPQGDSPYGVADMAGNVWEWTSGVFSHQPPQITQTLSPDGILFGTQRTVRGGSYLSPRAALRVTGRWGVEPGARLRGVGFRCAYDVAESP